MDWPAPLTLIEFTPYHAISLHRDSQCRREVPAARCRPLCMAGSLLDIVSLVSAAALGLVAMVLMSLLARSVARGGAGAIRRWRTPLSLALIGLAVLHGAAAIGRLFLGDSGAAATSLAWIGSLALGATAVALAVVTAPRRPSRASASGRLPPPLAVVPTTAELPAAAPPSSTDSRLVGLLLEGSADAMGTPLPADPAEFDARLMHANRMQSIGRLAGGIAHDFNNLLTSILTSAELAREALPDEHGVTPDLEEIRRAGTRASELTRQLLAFARRDVSRPRVIDANALVGNLATMLRRLLGETITLRMSLGSDIPLIHADSAQLEQVIVNLAVNARDAMPEGGELLLRTYRGFPSRHGAGDARPLGVALEVRDSGLGMSPEVRDRLFEPFFTTKKPGRGTGLGLATCHAIVVAHGGEIDVESRQNEGSTFRIWLPATDAVEEGGATPAFPSMPDTSPPSERTILLVEDDADVRGSTARALRRAGYEVIEAEDGLAALEQLAGREPALDLVIADVVMPRMGGLELVQRLQQRWPRVRTLFVSGYPVDSAHLAEVQAIGAHVLEKPYTPSILLFEVRLRLDAASRP